MRRIELIEAEQSYGYPDVTILKDRDTGEKILMVVPFEHDVKTYLQVDDSLCVIFGDGKQENHGV